MHKKFNIPWSLVFALTLISGTAITFFAIWNQCPLSMEGNSSGFKLQIEQCSNEDP